MGKLGSIFTKKVTLHNQYYSRDLVSYTFSVANIMSIMITILIIVTPLIVAFNGGDLWQKYVSESVQPDIKFTNKYYVNALFSNSQNKNQKISFDYSSLKPIRDSIQNSLSPPVITMIPIDNESNGLIDQFNITIRIKKPLQRLNLSQLNLILAFDYTLLQPIQMQLEGLAVISVDTQSSKTLNAGKITTHGNIVLRQPNALPITHSGSVRRTYDDNYFDTLEATSIQQFLYNYNTQRNETLQYQYTKNVQYGPSTQGYIDVEVNIKVPIQSINYVPGFWQIIKFAWVKYFSQFVFFFVVLHSFFLNQIMTGGIFDTVDITEIELKK